MIIFVLARQQQKKQSEIEKELAKRTGVDTPLQGRKI